VFGITSLPVPFGTFALFVPFRGYFWRKNGREKAQAIV